VSPEERWKRYLSYLEMKIDEGDWHGVMDAAADLRELEAAYPELKPNPFVPPRSNT